MLRKRADRIDAPELKTTPVVPQSRAFSLPASLVVLLEERREEDELRFPARTTTEEMMAMRVNCVEEAEAEEECGGVGDGGVGVGDNDDEDAQAAAGIPRSLASAGNSNCNLAIGLAASRSDAATTTAEQEEFRDGGQRQPQASRGAGACAGPTLYARLSASQARSAYISPPHDPTVSLSLSLSRAPTSTTTLTLNLAEDASKLLRRAASQPLPAQPPSRRDPNTSLSTSLARLRCTTLKASPRGLERLNLLKSSGTRLSASRAAFHALPGRIDAAWKRRIEHSDSKGDPDHAPFAERRDTLWSGDEVPRLELARLRHEDDNIDDTFEGMVQGVEVAEDGIQDGDADGRPPTPPPKDEAVGEEEKDRNKNNPYGNGDGRTSRTASVYTLSRASFSNQIQQLTAIKLPNAESLAEGIAAIPTSAAAAKALNDASTQIRIWMSKVSEVLEGLDAEDDIEWAAAGGRDGLGDVDAAISRFEGLMDVYVGAIEKLETRHDVADLSGEELQGVVDRMEKILTEWEAIKVALEGVKQQVELAMEWEELWNNVLGEIGQEVEALTRFIFEMEERRHRGILDAMAEPGKLLDIAELETIVEEAPGPGKTKTTVQRSSRAKGDASPAAAAAQTDEDKNLVSLFARMQPLRASLDFFPMRLTAFVQRAQSVFPTGCEELAKRQEFLEGKYKKIESDAESLRKELGEDRWVIIFRKAAEKALKMCESVERSISKLREALEEGVQHTNPPVLSKKLENYEAKKEHYGPAIQQVLTIIDRGVKQRLTVNGEILRLQADMWQRWVELQANIKGMDFAVEQLQVGKLSNQLRDSISTIMSEQRSVTSSMVDTPGSSPASSVVLLSQQSSDQGTSTPYRKSRTGSFAGSANVRGNPSSRHSSTSTPRSGGKTPLSRPSVGDFRRGVVGVSERLYPGPYSTPTPARSVSRADSRLDSRNDKPRWNSSTKTHEPPLGSFKPLTLTTPSPYRKVSDAATPRTGSHNAYGLPSPLSTSFSSSASALRPPSALARRPPSALARSQTPSALPKLRGPQPSSSTLPTRSGVKTSAPISRTLQTPRAGIPKPGLAVSTSSSSIYGNLPATSSARTPSSSTTTSAATPAPAPSSTTSNSSTATLTGPATAAAEVPAEPPTPTTPTTNKSPAPKTPTSNPRSGPSAAKSPDSSPSKIVRPSTSLASRRISMLPQPRATGSGMLQGGARKTSTSASTAAPTAPATAGAARRPGSRLSGLNLGGRVSAMGGKVGALGRRSFGREG